MTRKQNRYAALAAVRRCDWEAVTDDTLDILPLKHLHELMSEMGRRQAPQWLRGRVRDEIRRAEIDEMHAQEMGR
jgi:hypothetical protein